MTRYNHEYDSMYSIPQLFIDKELPQCPFCQSKEPNWFVGRNQKLFFKYYQFKCEKCESVISISEGDVTGLSYTTKSFEGMWKEHKGKKGNKIYVTIEKIGSSVKAPDIQNLKGDEMPLDELKKQVSIK